MIQEKLINLIIGSLLHDVGKVIYRISDHRKHSISGTEFLKNVPVPRRLRTPLLIFARNRDSGAAKARWNRPDKYGRSEEWKIPVLDYPDT